MLAACPDTLHGIRNRTLLLVLADSGLRASEVLRLLVEDWRPADRGLFVRAGKGRKDRIAFIGPTTMRALRAWLARHPLPSPESFIFCSSDGRPLKYRYLVQILHRLSTKAGLPMHRRLGEGTIPTHRELLNFYAMSRPHHDDLTQPSSAVRIICRRRART